MDDNSLKVMVLAGGPDRERPVSLASGAQVTEAVRAAGYDVIQRDITPEDLSALDEFVTWALPGGVIFPILHGAWGEGGGLQTILDERNLPYVGSRHVAATLCMDKLQTKIALARHHLPTPDFELFNVQRDSRPKLVPPVVIKPLREGSSIDLYICRDDEQVAAALAKLAARHDQVLIERYIPGKELTVGVIGDGDEAIGLPPIHIVPAVEFYDYDAKYERNDTRYVFDMPPDLIVKARALAVQAHRVLGCRHLSRVDFMVDPARGPLILEVNTLPGFTTHSLLPMAAARYGLPMPHLVDKLIRMAAGVAVA